jgi:hypothetical protein
MPEPSRTRLPPAPPASLRRRLLVGRRVTEPGCGRCGYPVRGLTGTTCPECGADQRVVGVVRPYRTPPILGTLALLGAWVALLWALASVGNDALLTFTPRQLSAHRDYALKPNSGLYGPLDVRRIGYGWGWKTDAWVPDKPDRGWVKMGPEELGGRYITDVMFYLGQGTLSFAVTRYEDNGARQTPLPSRVVALDEAGVLAWLATLEVDVSRPDVRAEAAELVTLLRAPDFATPHHEGLRQFVVTSFTGGPEIYPKEHGQALLSTAWVLVGLAGALLILWLRLRPKRGAAEVDVDASVA